MTTEQLSFYHLIFQASSPVSQQRRKLPIAVGNSFIPSSAVPTGFRNPLWMRCADRLRDSIDASGWYRQDIARLSVLSHVAVGAIEDGKRVPKLSTVERIATVLGLSPAWLAFGDEALEPFRPRRQRPIIPPDPPVPHPAPRPFVEAWRGVGPRIAACRASSGLALRAVADAAGISGQAVMLIEQGRSEPLISTVEQLAVALDVAPGWLAFGEGRAPEISDTAQLPPERRPS